MSAKRRSFEAGHRPKFLVVVDETPECERAVYFAARRSARLGASMVMLGVVTPPAENFEFMGVGDAMRDEAEDEARERLEAAAAIARAAAGVEAEQVVRSGKKADEIVGLIEEDEDISFLVLAAGVASEGPGPLVAGIGSRGCASFHVPIVIVPSDLTDAEIEALAG